MTHEIISEWPFMKIKNSMSPRLFFWQNHMMWRRNSNGRGKIGDDSVTRHARKKQELSQHMETFIDIIFIILNISAWVSVNTDTVFSRDRAVQYTQSGMSTLTIQIDYQIAHFHALESFFFMSPNF